MKGSIPDTVRNLAAMAMLAILAGCSTPNGTGPMGGPKSPNRDTVRVIPSNSPGPHPTTRLLVASNHTRITVNSFKVSQKGNGSLVIIEIQTEGAYQPTASVSPPR